MNAHEDAMRETSTGSWNPDASNRPITPSPSPDTPTASPKPTASTDSSASTAASTAASAPVFSNDAPYDAPHSDAERVTTAYGSIYTRATDGLRVYVTYDASVAHRFLCWGWPLHPRYSEDWCRRTGTYLFVALSTPRVRRAEAIAALPAADYRRWERSVLDAGESAEIRAARRRGRDQLRYALKHAQMRLDNHYHYQGEVNQQQGMGWVMVDLDHWTLRWPKSVKEGSIAMSDPRFSDYVRSGADYGYYDDGSPINTWFWYQQMPRPSVSGSTSDYDGDQRSVNGGTDIPPGALPLWYDEDGDSDTIQAIEGAADATPIFPALVHAYVTGDGKNVRRTRMGRIEKMLAWIRYVYGPRAAVAAEAYLLAQCPEYIPAYSKDRKRQKLAEKTAEKTAAENTKDEDEGEEEAAAA